MTINKRFIRKSKSAMMIAILFTVTGIYSCLSPKSNDVPEASMIPTEIGNNL
jgi:hypothetical protein